MEVAIGFNLKQSPHVHHPDNTSYESPQDD